jgi:hypothetical protein
MLKSLVPALVPRTACAPCDGFGIARNTATTSDVFSYLQVTNFDVSLLHSAPNGPDHTHIVIFVLCLHGPNYFVATFALEWRTDPINCKHFSGLPFPWTRQRARAFRSRCQHHRTVESQHHVTGCKTLRSRLHHPVECTTADRMAAHRKSDRRRDDLCEGALRKRGRLSSNCHQSVKTLA